MLWKPLEGRKIFLEMQCAHGVVRIQQWTAPAAASATAILNAQSLASGGTVTTFAGQPDKPRTLQYVASGATTANVTVNGTDIRGKALSETVALNGTTIVHGTHAFASITSIVLPTVAATTLNVGTDTLLGLDRLLPANTVFVYCVDGATDSAAPTVASNSTSGNVSLNTIKFNTAPNGTHNFLVCFVTAELTEATGTTS
jgi:hypothetical protein